MRKPGEDEEDVHADPAAAQVAEVEGDHGRDGDAPDAVERRPVPMFGCTPHSSPRSPRTRPQRYRRRPRFRVTSAPTKDYEEVVRHTGPPGVTLARAARPGVRRLS